MARTPATDSVTHRDSVAAYMDGVHVKIAEAYKPPRKIALPAAYNNKLPDVSKCKYDFAFDRAVLEKMGEWRKARTSIKKMLKAKMEEKQKREEEKVPTPSPSSDVENQISVVNAPPPENTILTPQLLSPSIHQIQDIKMNGLDYSDFDNDTSSPFDNMELKTINDMEELAQVLQPTSQWNSPVEKEDATIEAASQESDKSEEEQNDESVKEVETENKEDNNEEEENSKYVVSRVIEELRHLLERPSLEDCELWQEEPSETGKDTISQQNSSSKSARELSEEDQKLAEDLSDMGFSLSRASRAIRDLGGQDDKKVVDYLLALQYLEDAGIPEDAAAKALALTQYDEDKARRYHENLLVLKNFGFSEDRASTALLKCDIDRDKAIDLLIT